MLSGPGLQFCTKPNTWSTALFSRFEALLCLCTPTALLPISFLGIPEGSPEAAEIDCLGSPLLRLAVCLECEQLGDYGKPSPPFQHGPGLRMV